MSVGIFALALFAYLAAVYLTLEAQDAKERLAFRQRALIAWTAAAICAATVLVLAGVEVRRELIASPWALPLHLGTGASALGAFGALWLKNYQVARLAAAAQVSLILWGWALVQYPFAIRPHLTLAAAVAPEPVRIVLLQVLAVGAVVLLPSLLYLFRIFGPRGPYRAQPSQ